MAEHLGVKLVALGYDHPVEGFLLASATTDTSTDWNETVDLDTAVPDGAEENLNRAARLLGLDASGQRPRWILAAYQS
ncbi:hypothetical protein KGQ20_04175 [Catenulispora sp. NF23]|uniref:Uncharacterized protein n=1 Tax=Catenulispora pinistramenti TaxID=2705254 RepID=A0ABS5KKE7_9ACTN|nr:hypothetical protein [Catenulispora pinistramenti]MBS2531961.1 hypothetical protein [Catenulispora pinistramenti]MBS2546229.1 hypothetical protein [Catenulispora pinistramenti]